MKKRMFVVFVWVAILVTIVACAPKKAASTPPAPPVVQTVVVRETIVVPQNIVVTATLSPAAIDDATEVPEVKGEVPAATAVTECVLDSYPESSRFGVQLSVLKMSGQEWEFDPNNANRVVGDTTHPELTAGADLSGCPVLIEGRKTLNKEHHIWILNPNDGQYLDNDGVFRAKEFSAWAYPSNWNVEDFSTTKAPIAAEFVDAKVNNQKANDYSWPIFVHKSDGTVLQFKAGDKTGAVLPNNCNFTEPSHLNVTGVYNSSNKTFDASIGGEGCWTAAKIDGSWTSWVNAKDNVVFTSIEAWLMPSNFTEQNTLDWIAKQN